ncbi:MAG: Na+/H+ antiporter [Cyanobacteria bacterium SZAS LIN-2]|nr:Na+/H+ antiporter [Cyanobacteria bacterium SZAS LIN-2]
MQQVELIVAMLAVIGIVGALAQRVKVALPILLVITGMFISLLPNIPAVKLEPDVVFFIFLPPLLYLDAFNTPWKELKNVAETVSLAAVGLVLVTVFAVGAVVHAIVPGMPWSVAMALGAIVSPTDAVAASAISKEVQLPKRLMDIIKGESLVNDATGLVAYQFAVAATLTGAFSWYEAGTRFLYVAFGGVALGLLIGWILAKLRTGLQNRPVEIVSSLLSPFIAYLTAEHLHVSSVLSVVTAGLLLGWRGPRMHTSLTRLQTAANWETIAYVLNGFSFLLMGLQLRPILETVKIYPPQQLILWTAVAALAPILIRFVWSFFFTPVYKFLRKDKQASWKHLFVFSWAGMRGVVSLAAALALPLTDSAGQPFPYRDLLVFLTVAVIGSTLLLQGLTLPIIVKRVGFEPDNDNSEEKERQARLFLSREGVRKIDELARDNNIAVDDPHLQKILSKHLNRVISHISPSAYDAEHDQMWLSIQARTLDAQRKVLIAMREKNEIDEATFRLLQNELDFEQAHLEGKTPD